MIDSAALADRRALARRIDHTILKPEASAADIAAVCAQAREYGTAAVCVNSQWVPAVSVHLAGSDVRVCSVAGFPFGASPAEIVAREAAGAMEQGAAEIDTVAPIGLLRSGLDEEVRRHIARVRAATDGGVLKVILETAALDDDEIVRLARIAEEAGADFVKTSTGFHPSGGATARAVRLLRSAVTDRVQVKASGGIRDLATALEMIEAGASRLGLSATVPILNEL